MGKRLRRLLGREVVAPPVMIAPSLPESVYEAKARIAADGNPITEFPPAVTTVLRLYGARGSYASMYRYQPNVRTVVDFFAHEFAPITIKLYERVNSSKRLELDEHPSVLLLHKPGAQLNPRFTNYKMQDALAKDIGVYDIAYLGKVRPRAGLPPGSLVRIPPFALFPYRNPVDQHVEYYRTVNGVRIEVDDLIIFDGYDPESNSEQVAPLETLRRLMAEEWAAGMHRENLWKNAARQEGVIERPVEAPKWSDEAREGFLTDWESAMTGAAGAGKTAILEEGMQWKPDVWSPREAEYLGARKLSREETCAAYNVSLELVSGKATKEERTAFYTGRLNSLLTRVEQGFQSQLLPEFETFDAKQRQYYEFNIEEKLKGSFEEQASIGSTAVGGPWLTVNEFRARFNLPPVEGGDELFVPLNSVNGGGPQASPQSPTETPADSLEPAGTTPGGGTAPPGDKSRLRAQEMEDLRGPFVAFHTEQMRKFFERQRRVMKSRDDGVFDKARWTKELADDLLAMSLSVTGFFGKLVASRMNSEYSVERTVEYWRKNALATAQTINAATEVDLVDKEVDAVFDRLAKTVAPQLALTRTQREMNWAVLEAARQNGG